MTWRLLLRSTMACAAIAMMAGACSDDAPRPGTLTVSLTSTVTDGAILLSVTGPELQVPQPSNPSFTLYWRQVSTTELRVAVFGPVANGPLFTLPVTDVRQATGYAGVVHEVAARNDALRDDLSGYAIAVTGGE